MPPSPSSADAPVGDPIETIGVDLAAQYAAVRAATEHLCGPLAVEDYVVQSMPDASPAKWHLAHTSWFFETFVLAAVDASYQPFHPRFSFLFNSYYVTVGERYARSQRGLLTRPTVPEVYAYRRAVDAAMDRVLSQPLSASARSVIALGIHHEQQHQELLLTDLKHMFGCNPLRPTYRTRRGNEPSGSVALQWVEYPEGLVSIGHDGAGFAFDNESPRHRVFLDAFALGSRLVTNREYRAFLEDGGYRRPEWWMSDGWDAACAGAWTAPLYWEPDGGGWLSFTLAGMRPVVDDEPVCHVSYFEADAYARWAGARLPTEAEWETAAAPARIDGNFADRDRLHPAPATSGTLPTQLFGDVWEWTSSPYVAYPGFRPPAGALGEYNGKFMCNQFVLRGGSCVTPQSHMRATYRNFFAPAARWQFMGIRLARSA